MNSMFPTPFTEVSYFKQTNTKYKLQNGSFWGEYKNTAVFLLANDVNTIDSACEKCGSCKKNSNYKIALQKTVQILRSEILIGQTERGTEKTTAQRV